jgi:hypothetical protein
MADLDTAFGSSFQNPCSLSFDVVPQYFDNGCGDNRTWLGIVTVQCSPPLSGFSYRVFDSNSEPISPFGNGQVFPSGAHPLLDAASRSTRQTTVIEGVVSESNNPTFTFPISSPTKDYFVLVTPMTHQSNAPIAPLTSSTLGMCDVVHAINPKSTRASAAATPPMGFVGKTARPEFAIFYTTRVLRQRQTRIAARKNPVPFKVEKKVVKNEDEIPKDQKDDWKSYSPKFESWDSNINEKIDWSPELKAYVDKNLKTTEFESSPSWIDYGPIKPKEN